MKSLKAALTGLALFMALTTPALAEMDFEDNSYAVSEKLFEADQSCVGFRTARGIVFFVKKMILGRNCEVTSSLETSKDGKATINVRLRAKDFKTGIKFRDGQVALFLHFKRHPYLELKSTPMPLEQLRKAVAAGSIGLKAKMTVNGEERDVVFPIHFVNRGGDLVAVGLLNTTYSYFNVQVPKVSGYGFPPPTDNIDLLVHIHLSQIKNIEALDKKLAARVEKTKAS